MGCFCEGVSLPGIILDKPDIRVKSVTTQKRIKNLLGRDICLDIAAEKD